MVELKKSLNMDRLSRHDSEWNMEDDDDIEAVPMEENMDVKKNLRSVRGTPKGSRKSDCTAFVVQSRIYQNGRYDGVGGLDR